MMLRQLSRALLVVCGLAVVAGAEEVQNDPLAAWRAGVSIRPVSPGARGHTFHSYFNTCPESPDGKFVLYFASSTADGQLGDVCIRHRKTGEEKTLAKNIVVEDAHRVACQQWVSQGKRVVFHGERDGEWIVTAVDIDTLRTRDLAKGRLAGWGQPHSHLVPLYKPHWNPGPHPDLELLDVETGTITTALTMQAVKEKYPDFIAQSFADKPASIFFPILSPDTRRVFFKLATPAGGDPRSPKASTRLGLVSYHLADQRFLFATPRWGHPSWHPDAKTIVEKRYELIDADTGKSRQLPGLPSPRGDHPSASPDGQLIVTDSTLNIFDPDSKEWGILLADARGSRHLVLHKFDNSGGASSWRRSHPHPIFSPDGHRIYFNISSGTRTQLYVAERAPVTPPAKP